MKTLPMILALMLINLTITAQEITKMEAFSGTSKYIEVTCCNISKPNLQKGSSTIEKSILKIFIDDGVGKYYELRKKYGSEFYSRMDALNFITSGGYTIIGNNVISVKTNTGETNLNYTYLLIKTN